MNRPFELEAPSHNTGTATIGLGFGTRSPSSRPPGHVKVIVAVGGGVHGVDLFGVDQGTCGVVIESRRPVGAPPGSYAYPREPGFGWRRAGRNQLEDIDASGLRLAVCGERGAAYGAGFFGDAGHAVADVQSGARDDGFAKIREVVSRFGGDLR